MANKFTIRGGKPLEGGVKIRGSKNAATKMMIASLLTDQPCRIENIPLSEDVFITKELCSAIGSVISFDEHTCRIETPHVKTSLVPELSRRNRIPILAFGPLLHRQGFAEIPVLGGCPIGHRPINFHIEALAQMGVKIERREKSYFAEAGEISGTEINLPYPSVGATENIILTAVLARGRTMIRNAAVEPEIMNLADMLLEMGAKISCAPESRVIEIEGVKKLKGAEARVMPDRNEIVSFAVAAVATGGDVLLQDIKPEMDFNCLRAGASSYLKTFLDLLEEAGGNFRVESDGTRFIAGISRHPVFIQTSPHPGFMTDWQQPFCVLLTQARGKSIIHETVYEDRFEYAKDLKRMGAQIEIMGDCPQNNPCRFQEQKFNHTAIIDGPTPLHGEAIRMTDIRAGMAHIIAALAAKGESVITGVEHVDRGYEKIDERLQALGADIQRIKTS